MKRKFIALLALTLLTASTITGCGASPEPVPPQATSATAAATPTLLAHQQNDASLPVVYYTKDISPQGLLKTYKALNQNAKGNVGIKTIFEAPGVDYLDPNLLKPLADEVNGTLLDSNGFSSPRNTTTGHLQVAKDHGFAQIAPIDILDSEGELDIPVTDGKHLKFHRVGSHLANYDTLISVVQFKPHTLRDYDGTIKNLTICLASIGGKGNIHSGGQSLSFSENGMIVFMESMAEATKAALDYKKDSWAFINVLSNLEVNDSCNEATKLADIGIIASLDPVAVDSAALDFTYGTGDANTRQSWERRHNADVLKYAEARGAGKINYRLVNLDEAEQSQSPITVSINGTSIKAVLNDSPEAAAFKEMLPATIKMAGFGGREYYGPSPREISTAATGNFNFTNGQITYCPTNNTIAIFYDQANKPNLTMGVIPIGEITDDLAIFHKLGASESISFTADN